MQLGPQTTLADGADAQLGAGECLAGPVRPALVVAQARLQYDSLAFRYIACNGHPDHDTLASFRRRVNKEFEDVFVSMLQVAWENQLSQFGSVSLDGTRIHANASRYSALSFGHAERGVDATQINRILDS